MELTLPDMSRIPDPDLHCFDRMGSRLPPAVYRALARLPELARIFVRWSATRKKKPLNPEMTETTGSESSTDERTGESFHLSKRDKVLALSGTLAALLMAGLDQTIVATAGPEIQRDLQIPAALYAWITTSYLVASTVMLPIFGKLSDIFGRKPILLVGVVLFLFGSFLCGMAPTTGFLIGARAIQGLGSASLFTTTLAVIADLFPPKERGKYMGLIGAVMGISSVIGPMAGGIITDTLGWNWVFFVNLPVGAVALWLIVTKMPRIGGGPGKEVQIDFAGAFWLIAAVVPFLLALSLGRMDPVPGDEGFAWGSWQILGMMAVAVISVFAFLRTEKRAADPIIDLKLFSGNRTIGTATATVFVLGATFLFTVIFLPLYLVNVVGISATQAGFSLMPLTIAMVLTSVLAGQISARVGSVKGLLLGALSLLFIAFLVMAFTLTPESTVGSITVKMILIGLGMGPTLPLYTLIVQNSARPREIGVATSGSIFARSLGQVIGIALFGTLFAASLISSAETRSAEILAGLPEDTRDIVAGALPAVSGGGEGTAVAFDETEVRKTIERSFEAAGSARPAPAANPTGGIALPPAAVGIPVSDQAAALAAVDQIREAFALSLTEATSVLYKIGAVLVLIALFLTARIPSVPSHGGRSPHADPSASHL